MSVKALIFDLDGTLVNSLGGLTAALNLSLTELGFPEVDTHRVRLRIGHGMKELVRKSIPDQAMVDLCFQRMLHFYQHCWDSQLYVYDGIIPLLNQLNSQAMAIGVNTNKEEAMAETIVRRFLPLIHRDQVLGRNDSRPAKPDPAGALWLAEKWKIAPEHILYIGDSEVDLQTARNAGNLSVAVSWGFRDVEILKAENPDFLIEHPREILKLLQ